MARTSKRVASIAGRILSTSKNKKDKTLAAAALRERQKANK
jgi:hypothetical protein